MPKGDHWTLVITCEHAGAKIPAPLSKYFTSDHNVLKTHRACDFGALPIAKFLSKQFQSPLFYTEISRLVVDCNRSLNHRGVISPYLETLPAAEKDKLLERFYKPYRQIVESEIASLIKGGKKVLHLSVHSFTPVLNGVKRTADIGLLFDPRRRSELRTCVTWQKWLRMAAPEWRIRRNYPYKGIADGFTTSLRRLHRENQYQGIELELNQGLVGSYVTKPNAMVADRLAETLRPFLK